MCSREPPQDIAAKQQLQPATLERVIRLIDILDAFGADTLIGPRIALKGGKALNAFNSDLDVSRSISTPTMSARPRRSARLMIAQRDRIAFGGQV